jgi:hypothetical protein
MERASLGFPKVFPDRGAGSRTKTALKAYKRMKKFWISLLRFFGFPSRNTTAPKNLKTAPTPYEPHEKEKTCPKPPVIPSTPLPTAGL